MSILYLYWMTPLIYRAVLNMAKAFQAACRKRVLQRELVLKRTRPKTTPNTRMEIIP